MKKILGCILCGMLVVFMAMPAAADILVMDQDSFVTTSDSYFGIIDGNTSNDLWAGNDTNPDYIKPTNPDTEEAWLNSLLDNTSDDPVEFIWKDENSGDGWQAPASWTYAVLKYGVGDGGDVYSIPAPASDHWAIMDDGNYVVDFSNIFDTDGETLYDGLPEFGRLSHISYFGPQGVPEPATMFLLGTGLVVLAGFGRKKFLK